MSLIRSTIEKSNLRESGLREFFDSNDQDKNGTMDAGEIKNLLTSDEFRERMGLEKNLSDNAAEIMAKRADINRDGYIQFDEFSDLVERALLRDEVDQHTMLGDAAVAAGWAPAKPAGRIKGHAFHPRKHILKDEIAFFQEKQGWATDDGTGDDANANGAPKEGDLSSQHAYNTMLLEIKIGKEKTRALQVAQRDVEKEKRDAEIDALKKANEEIERRENEILKAKVSALEKKLKKLKEKKATPSKLQPTVARSGGTSHSHGTSTQQTPASSGGRGAKSPKSARQQQKATLHPQSDGRRGKKSATDINITINEMLKKSGKGPRHANKSTSPHRARFDGAARLSNYFNHHGVYPGSSKFMEVLGDFPAAPNGGMACRAGDILYINFGAQNAYDGMIMAITYDGKKEGFVPFKLCRPVASDMRIAAGFDVHHLAVLDSKYRAAHRRSMVLSQGGQLSPPMVLAGGDPAAIAEFQQNQSMGRTVSVTRIGEPTRTSSPSFAGSPDPPSAPNDYGITRNEINDRVMFHNVQTPYHSPLANAQPAPPPPGAWCC